MSDESDLYFRQIAVGDMANLVYLVGSRSTREALVVDPAWSVDGLIDQAEEDGIKVVGALVTHYHQDHIGGSIFGMEIEGLERFMERSPGPIHVQKLEAEGVAKVSGIPRSEFREHEGGDIIELGGIRVRLLHTPGHTPGSQCFLVEEAGQPSQLVSGDTLFLGSCGRVDLPGIPSALSPIRARRSGIEAGDTPHFSATPASSMILSRMRSQRTIRSPSTHWAKSLSGEQITIRSTDFSTLQRAAPVARASSASKSTMGQTVIPRASAAASARGNCA